MSYENLKLSVRREKATVTVLRVTVHFELCNIVCTVCYCVLVYTYIPLQLYIHMYVHIHVMYECTVYVNITGENKS